MLVVHGGRILDFDTLVPNIYSLTSLHTWLYHTVFAGTNMISLEIAYWWLSRDTRFPL